MSFIIYDLVFLAIFTLVAVVFLYKRKQNLQRQGLLYLYRTRIGLRIIEWTSKKYARILKPMEYVVITSGYILMALVIWFLAKLSYVYLTSPTIARDLKVPVLIPLIPYLPELFKIDFLPPFYFTYWIIIIAIIAIPHEFAHGIFARLNKVRVHSTGFGFLGPFLAAFVEPDEKQMAKKKKMPQMAILASGTFANVVMTVLFGLILWIFFISTFAPAGVFFNTYSTAVINTSTINSVNNISLDNLDSLDVDPTSLVEVKSSTGTYYTSYSVLKQSIEEDLPYILAYENSPAFSSKLQGAITEFDGVKIASYDQLRDEILRHSPGDEIIIKTSTQRGEIKEYNIKLSERDGKAYLGIGVIPFQGSGVMGKIYSWFARIKDPFIYYESTLGDLGVFIYDLLWWIVIINISVALANMLPMGIFDGGRFFFLTVWGLTGSRKSAEIAFKLATWLILALVIALMLKWFFAVF